MSKKFKWQWGSFFVGMMIMAFGITMTIKGNVVGTAPWDVFHIGLYKQIGLTIGSWSILTGLTIIIGTSIYLKRIPKLATFLNMLFIGSFIDLFNWLLPETSIFVLELAYFTAGFFVMSIGCALYIAASLGEGPRDTIMMIIASKGYSVKTGRLVMEVFATGAGWLLGGPVGFGTVILALGTGYVIQPSLFFFKRKLEEIIGEPLT
ncbi:YczE/YyaS/YitT family protein [Solibacillus isronensis]|uniref:YczE/YyaS/YitT family protein n=1 Tax=Solibacillus isronensis TaxID=412383 RepID=UPI00203BAEA9|nr:YitT family protein [Solibacillus isronensis]